MSDASSLPLDAGAAPRVSSSPWKRRGGALAAFAGGAALAVVSMCARPNLPGGLWIGVLGTSLAGAALLAFFDSWRAAPAAELERRVSGRVLIAPAGQAVSAALWLWILLRLAVSGVLPMQTWLLAAAVPVGFVWLTGALGLLGQRL